MASADNRTNSNTSTSSNNSNSSSNSSSSSAPTSAANTNGTNGNGSSAVSAQTKREIEQQIKEKEDQLKEIETKIETYENLIEVKQQQQATLANQLEIIEGQISRTKERITKTQEDMKLVQLEITALELDIREKDIDIRYNKNILSELIKAVYENSQATTVELLLKYDNLTEYFAQIEYLNNINNKTKDVLQQINTAKAALQSQRDERKEKFEKLEQLKNEDIKNKFYLESEQYSKESIMESTQGEEAKYQEMLARVEEQRQTILGDIGDLSLQKEGELSDARAHQKRPKSGLANTNWYFSQRDSRWASDNIGLSRTKMENYGCAVTSVAMVLRYHGVSIDPGFLAKQKIFSHDLIVWPSSWQGVERIGSNAHGNIDWDVIDDELKHDNVVIVFIRANGRGAGHYVVIHHKDKEGRYIVHDPYWGPNIFLDSTRENIGILYRSGTSIDQMIIYHASGDRSKISAQDDSEGDDTEGRTEATAEETAKAKACNESGGTWDEAKKTCTCPNKYKLNKDTGKCKKQ